MPPAPDLGKDAILLHLPVEPPEHALEALPLLKDYFSHIDPPFLTKMRHIPNYFSH